MSPVKQHLNDDETFVEGRSREKAAELIELAKKADLTGSVRTTYNGYIVPTAILKGADKAKHAAADAEGTTPPAGTEASDPAAGEGTAPADAKQFDVTEATVEEVQDYLAHSDATERERVLAAEAAREKPRKGVLDLATTSEGDK